MFIGALTPEGPKEKEKKNAKDPVDLEFLWPAS
jgi:hypothetical protein